MAARAKKSSRSRSKAKSARAGGTASTRKSGRSTRASANGPAVKRSAASPKLAGQRNRKATVSTRKGTTTTAAKTRKKPVRGDSPIARVTRVAKEIAHQATTAVTGGVEAIKEAGESLVDRVTA